MILGCPLGYHTVVHPWIERGYVLRDVISKLAPALMGVSYILPMIHVTFLSLKIERDKTMIYSLQLFHLILLLYFH
jgi:hypothetical protein